MTRKQIVLAGIAVAFLLANGVYFINDVYSQSGKKDAGKTQQGADKSQSPKEDPTIPVNMLKTADKLLADADETKDSYALVMHSELMLKKAADIIEFSRKSIELLVMVDPKTDKSGMLYAPTNMSMLQTAIKLINKSAELTAKYDSLIPERSRENLEKQGYKCPNGCQISHQKSKCFICGAGLIEK